MSSPYTELGARAPLSLTSDGALQFAGIVRKTGLLISGVSVFSWKRAQSGDGEAEILRFLDEHASSRGGFLLLGTGRALTFPSPAFMAAIDGFGMGLDVMDTSAACQTYNVLLAEARLFSAALFPLS